MATGGRSLAKINAKYKTDNPLPEETSESSRPSGAFAARRPGFGASSSSYGRSAHFLSDADETSSGRLPSPPPTRERRSLGSYFSSFFSRADDTSEHSSDHEEFTTPPEPPRRPPSGARRPMSMDDLESLRFGPSLAGESSRPPPPPPPALSTKANSEFRSRWSSWIPESVRRSLPWRASSAGDSASTHPPRSGPPLSRAASRYTPAGYMTEGSTVASSIPPVRPSSTAPPARPTPISTFASSAYASQQSGYNPRLAPIAPPRGLDGSVYTQSQINAPGPGFLGSIMSGVSGAFSYMTGGGGSSAARPASPSQAGHSGGHSTSAPPHQTSFGSETDIEAGGGARLPPIGSSFGTQGASYYSRAAPGGRTDRYNPNASVYSRPLLAPASQSSFGVSRDPNAWGVQSSAVPHYHQVSTPGSYYNTTQQSTRPHYHYLSQPSQQSQQPHYHYSTQVTGPSRWGGLKTGAFSHIGSDDILNGQVTRWEPSGGVESHVYARDGSAITHTVNRWGQSGVTQSSVTYGSKW